MLGGYSHLSVRGQWVLPCQAYSHMMQDSWQGAGIVLYIQLLCTDSKVTAASIEQNRGNFIIAHRNQSLCEVGLAAGRISNRGGDVLQTKRSTRLLLQTEKLLCRLCLVRMRSGSDEGEPVILAARRQDPRAPLVHETCRLRILLDMYEAAADLDHEFILASFLVMQHLRDLDWRERHPPESSA